MVAFIVQLGSQQRLSTAHRHTPADAALPANMQELVTPKVLTGRDIVLAAETGSGKTLAYIAPLASMLLQRAAAGQHPPPPQLLKEDGGSSHSSTYKPKDRCGCRNRGHCQPEQLG